MEKIENIKRLWLEIENKTDFILKASKFFNRKPNTLRTHWFCGAGFWSVPEDKEDKVIEFMQKYIKIQYGILAE